MIAATLDCECSRAPTGFIPQADYLQTACLMQNVYLSILACRVRLLSLAAQRFIATALHDAMQIQAKRQKQPSAQLKGAGHELKDKRLTLTIEDLAQALQEVCSLPQGSPLPCVRLCLRAQQ